MREAFDESTTTVEHLPTSRTGSVETAPSATVALRVVVVETQVVDGTAPASVIVRPSPVAVVMFPVLVDERLLGEIAAVSGVHEA